MQFNLAIIHARNINHLSAWKLIVTTTIAITCHRSIGAFTALVCTVTKKKKKKKRRRKKRKMQRGEVESSRAKPTYGGSNVYRMHGVSPEVDVWFFSDAHLPVRALCTLTEIMVASYQWPVGSSFGGALRRKGGGAGGEIYFGRL